VIDTAAIFWYNALHLALALAIGVFVTRLVAEAERRPARGPIIWATVLAGGVVTVLAVGYLTQPMRTVLPWWSIVVANLLAAALAGFYLVSKHPGLLRHGRPFVPAR
jgi:protein-S-isoprenylcysteine O-methyltransferase Ste14